MRIKHNKISKYPKYSMKRESIIASAISNYNLQKCENCGHTLYLNVKENKKECNWCHHINTNQTKGFFNYNLTRLLDKNNYKIRRIENGKEN